MFFADRFAELQQTHGADPAIIFTGETISFGDLVSRGWQVGNALLKMGIPRQERVAHISKNNPEFFEIFIGTCSSGYPIAGINWRLAGPEIVQILNNAESTVLMVGQDFYATIEAIRDQLTHVRHIIAVNGGHDDWIDYTSWRDQQPKTRPEIILDGNDDILQLYTSGTTGLPKGVQLTNQGFSDVLQSFVDSDILNVGKDSTFINVMPLFHVGGTNFSLLPLLRGSSLHLLVDFEPTAVLDTLENSDITHALFVPAMIQMLLQEANVRNRDYSQLERIYYGASPISESVLLEAREVFCCDFMQLYGATENYGLVTMMPPEAHAPKRNKLRSCGHATVGGTVKIVDLNNQEVPNSVVGEILLKAPWILKSYWKNPAATAEVKNDGWYRTGDAGCLDDEGFVYIKDRMKDMVITGGENVFPAEVENALYSHEDIIDVAVIGVPDEKWGESLKAIVVAKPNAKLSENDVIDYARSRIAGFKIPKSIEFIEELPRNPSGKILRRVLRAPYWKGKERGVG